jgi:hypothetical protein
LKRSILLVALAAAIVALVLTSCSGSSSGGSSAASSADGLPGSAVAYSACMRSHAVPSFPDPDSTGSLTKADARQLGVSDAQLQAAEQACRHLLPDYGTTVDAGSVQQCMEADVCPPALVQQVLIEERRFAQCMRSHGVPHWPDPSIDPRGRPVFVISISELGFDPYARAIWAKGNDCAQLMPGLPGLPAAVSP